MATLRKGEWVWLDSEFGVPIGARVKVTPSGQRFLVDDDGQEQWLSPELEASVRTMHPTSVEGVDDMIKLGDMTEAGLLRNLQLRHKKGIIYTYIGSVLVAVNPYQNFPLYSNEKIKLYHGRKLGELPPHIFAIAESCYYNMKRHSRNQCCIISGESGAGKTESTKLLLHYLAAVSGQLSEQEIEQQILESNPILEAFGNAKTVRNDNSSRFGKYLEIFFNKSGVIEGARVEQYLLEKSRVCHQSLEERNYHIFYCLLAGLSEEEKKVLSLGHAKEYTFLTKGGCILCDSREDDKDYQRISAAMKVLTFSENQCQDVVKLLAAILHLGNVRFEANTQNNLDTCDISKSKHFNVAASLLQVPKSSLTNSLTQRSFMTNRERVTKPLSCEQASDCRDAVVKAIYNKLFMWIVNKINTVIYKKLQTNHKSSFLSVGLLDIFGFENFNKNSFEQLCINFANEKLQQFFVGHIFKLEQKEYQKEGIVWNNITFSDNQNILDLLAVKPCNLLALIDEETSFPKGTDGTLLIKLNTQHKRSKLYIPTKSEHDTDFGVHHFSGVVYYNSQGFLEKNRDAISFDVIRMVESSKNRLLRQTFERELSVNGVNGVKVTNNHRISIKPPTSFRGQADNHKQVQTLSGQFRQSLDSLMKALSACQPYFIRCFKPNNDKISEFFDRELCIQQLRYSGMMDTIRIRKLGYPIRHSFVEFLKRYRVLLKTTICNPNTQSAAACCEAICRAVIKQEDEWKIGRTKVFLKDAHDMTLERLREEELSRVALVIQRVMLGIKDRKLFLKKRAAVLVLQKHWRAHMKDKAQRKIQLGFERLIAAIKNKQLRKQYIRQRAAAITIQSQVRGYMARKKWNQIKRDRQKDEMRDKGYFAATQIEIMQKQQEISEKMSREVQEGLQLMEDAVVDELTTDGESDLESAEGDIPVAKEAMYIPKIVISEKESDRSRTSSMAEEEEEEDDYFEDSSAPFSFNKFCDLHFQGNASPSHITHRLKKPLLAHDDEGDALACLTVWWIILRFMGDHPESRSNDSVSLASSTISSAVPNRGGRRLSSLVGIDALLLRKNKKKLGGGGTARKASIIPEEPEEETEDILIGEGPTLDRPMTSLEKVHTIIGYAISRPGIRDEIYCQICKQLVNNNKSYSRQQGWLLLSICLGIFPPTDLFMQYLENFIQRGPNGYKEYCSQRLKRIKTNGERKEVACWIELEAARNKKPIDTSVQLMNDQTVTVSLDSASTSAEVCQTVANQVDLADTYGFSLYINFEEKTWSLGSCGRHVLDAVSQCEQEMRRQGKEEKNTPWKLLFRKELFTPWHDCSLDPVSTTLIYEQVIREVKSGRYTSDKEDDYVLLAVQHYYIQFGSEYNALNARKVVGDCITTTLIESKSMNKWIQLINTGHSQALNHYGRQSADTTKEELVDFARQKWPVFFSRFYEVTMTSGPDLDKSRFIVAVNWSSIIFLDGPDKRLLEFPYIEVKNASMKSEGYLSAQLVTLATFQGEFVLKTAEAEEMTALIRRNLEGLRERSDFAIVLTDNSKPEDPTHLVCRRGDVLQIRKNEHPPHDNMYIATNQRNGDTGVVYKSILQFLPTLTMPSPAAINVLNPSRNAPATPNFPQHTVAPVSLKEFALEHFSLPGTEAGRQGVRRGVREKLWVSSREPLKQPLLKSLVRNSDLSYLACNAFTAILKYMGDYPIKQVRSPIELTDQIFGPATQHEALQDEIYCQIMKQMTSNNNRLSMTRGWQLLWLCTGLFAPSPSLMVHAKRFLESRPRDPLSPECQQRLQGILSKPPRKLPPHFVEVDAIQQDSTQIFHKVYFPNETEKIVEVSSTITIKGFCQRIAHCLQLLSADGYGLYLKTINKPLQSLEDQEYLFDSLRQASDLPKRMKVKKIKDGNQARVPYLVILKRKLWFNVSPGKDSVADLTFHFPQEVPKYLEGYHDCTKEDMIELAGLLFRVHVDSDRSQFVMIPKMLKDLVPADQIGIMSPEEWKKHVISSYNRQSGSTVEEAKVAFLKTISSWPTFGSSFFEIKQTCESSYPTNLRIAISKQGVSLIDPATKELLAMYQFNRLKGWNSKGAQFQMTIGTLLGAVTFFCECPKSETMVDLIQSYVNMYNEERKVQPIKLRNDNLCL
ncbi:unconventional myosin-VIIa-like isoform X2 [Boleophthalmus pectinirostris]|uniref:unconventional myosin-VIIa-like isoform X2 n=1 Tax=Boleophthalmus pectinirostris TaxID=150288 RepID=UPI00242F7D51|nr:unconventional myosin-VIIa-like isoform X2 [Boleophthalmus pectinirostris]